MHQSPFFWPLARQLFLGQAEDCACLVASKAPLSWEQECAVAAMGSHRCYPSSSLSQKIFASLPKPYLSVAAQKRGFSCWA